MEPPDSPIQSDVLTKGSVLCLDIDGVCSPLGQNPRFNIFGPHPGFVAPPQRDVPFHPALPNWLVELDRAFTHVAWISSWNRRCGWFASRTGADCAVGWPYLPPPEPANRDKSRWGKLEAVRHWIAPDQPVAFVDDDLVQSAEWGGYDRTVNPPIEHAQKRPGPLLLLAPSREIGLSREAVDLLREFARDPNARQFEDRAVRAMHSDWWTQWPWPLADHENPVAIEVEDERAWREERVKMQAARRREIRP